MISADGWVVRRVGPGDEAMVRSVRLQSLSEDPGAFDSDLKRELEWSVAEWRRWIHRGATFVLESDEGALGLVAGVPHWTDPNAAFLLSLWVNPQARGTGAADALVDAVLEWARDERKGDVWLHVGKENEPAKRCYERNGFHATGAEVMRDRDGLVEIEMRHELNGTH